MSGFWYLSSPYSKWPSGIEDAHYQACVAAGTLIRAGIPVYSPIAHSHPIAVAAGIDPLGHELWMWANKPMMDAAWGLIVLMMPGWQESVGITIERGAFLSARKLEIQVAWPMTPEIAEAAADWCTERMRVEP